MRVLVILLILALTTVGSPLFANRAPISARADTPSGSWSQTTDYPENVTGERCVTDSGYVYCIGGENGAYSSIDHVYFAPLTPTGIPSWSSSTSYPFPVSSHSCVADSGFVFCMGGANGTSPTSAVYFARLSSNGISSWSQTTNYPMNVQDEKCVTDSGFVYCVGGNYGSDAVYFAQLNSTGVGQWSPTTSYPGTLYGYSCAARSGYVYCIGGYWPNGYVPRNWVYFAQLSSQGVGPWSETSSYPINNIAYTECVINSDRAYCMGGLGYPVAYDPHPCLFNCFYPPVTAVDYTTLSDNGTSLWSQTASFPFPIAYQSCVVYSGTTYCIGGTARSAIRAVYFATLSTLPTLDFALSSSGNMTVPQGSSASTPISIDIINGTSQSTWLYCDRSYVLPCSFSPQYGQTPYTSVLTIPTFFCSTNGNTAVGSYVIRVIGTTNGQQHSINVTLTVTSGGPPDVAILGLAPSKNSAYNGIFSPVPVTATVQNLKDVTETVQLSIYENDTLIAPVNITLAACESRVVSVPWQTGSMTGGLYLLTGNITSVPGEVNLSNDQAAWNGLFKIHRLRADTNDDCTVDVSDLALVGRSFGMNTSFPQNYYNSDADINNSGTVDISDLTLVAANFGHTC